MPSDPALEYHNGNGHDRYLPALVPEQAVGEPRYQPIPSGDEIHLRDYWETLLRHRWTVAAVFAAVVVSGILLTVTTVPSYRATTLVEIRAESQKVVAFQDVVQMAQVEREFYQTQFDVLQSRRLARRVIDRLKLDEEAAFQNADSGPGLLSRLRMGIASIMTRTSHHAPASAESADDQAMIDRFLSSVDVKPRRNSYLVEVSFTSPSPHVAADVANALAEEYVDMSLDQRIEAVQKGREFIVKQLGVTKAALEHSEEELQAFARRNEILTVDSKQNIEYAKLSDLNESLTRAQHERMAKEALFNQVNSKSTTQLSQLTSNPVIAQLTSELAKLEAVRAQLAETFTPEYPKLLRTQAQIKALRAQIVAEQATLAGSMRADYEASKKQEEMLRDALEAQKRIVSDLNQRAIDYKILKRETDTNRSIYNSLLQRLKEVEVTEGIKASNIHVVDAAEVPVRAARPRPLVNLAVAILLGLIGGVALAFVQEHLDNSVKTPDDVERYLRLPTLGALPLMRVKRNANRAVDVSPELVVVEDPKSPGAEAMRTLRASLFLSTAAGPPQRLVVTSARPGEGKTCITANLAVILAQMGRRVIIVDCDFRRPRVHRVFGFDLDVGATSYLTGNSDLPSAIRATPYGVDVMVGGPVPPNPVELIDSPQMVNLVDELSRRYDFVLLDAPPSLGFADVPLLARLVGGVLFVVRAGETPRKAAANATQHLQRLRAKLLGVVLNGVRTGGPGYYSSYYSYYSYYNYYEYKPDAERTANGHDHELTGPHTHA